MGERDPSARADALRVADVLSAAPAVTELADASDLDAAIDAGLLIAVFQPVIELATGRVVAVEALARLRDPDGGALRTPDLFIPLAERTGRIARIDRLVLAAAVPFAVCCRAQLSDERFTVAVNISVAGLDDTLAAYVEDLCTRSGLPLTALIIEVTETALSTPGDGHERALQALHDLGCNVAMDDFGTGYSSLSHLVRFPVDGIKIDRQFVWDVDRGGKGALVAAALITLGHDLGVHVVAEGVETESQLAALLSAGCAYGQGYLFSRPLAQTALLTFLKTQVAVSRTGTDG